MSIRIASPPQMKYISFFTGGGGADIGAKMAGLDPVEGYEYVEAIAHHAEQQLGHIIHCENILDLNVERIIGRSMDVDFAHFSPPCPAFSVANNNKGETENDILLALKIAEIITVKKFKYLTLENVWGYRKSESWRIISSTLNVVYGFGWDVNHINFADYGVPQTRKRMMVRAIKDRIIMPPLPLKQKWIGWYEAIEDLIPALPDSQFAPWQIERLKNAPELDFIVSGQTSSYGKIVNTRKGNEPVLTITTSSGNQKSIRAYLVEGVSYDRPIGVLAEETPSMVIAAGKGGREPKGFVNGRVLVMTPRALARFQTFPDWYELPEKKTLATTIIGNAVPPVGYAEIVKSMINDSRSNIDER